MVGVVEVFQRPGAGPATQNGYQRFLMQMCDLAGDFFKSRKLKHYSDRQAMWTQLEEFTRRVHASLDPRETAYTIANEGRRLIECDRVSVAIKRGNRCRIEAVSGQDLFDKRSNTVRLLGELATAVVAGGEPIWYTGDTSDMAPQVEDAVQEYVDESHSKTVAVLPLYRPRPEPTDDEEEEDLRRSPRWPSVRWWSSRSKTSGCRRRCCSGWTWSPITVPRRCPTPRTTTTCSSCRSGGRWARPAFLIKARTLPKTSAVAGAVLAAILFLCFWPANFELQGEGTLEPVDRRDVFAGIDGVVEDVFVKHGDMVDDHPLVSAATSAGQDGRDGGVPVDDPRRAGRAVPHG